MLEYAVLISIVAAVLVAMSPLIRRSIQGIIKVTSDQLALQEAADQGGNFAEPPIMIYHTSGSYANRADTITEAANGVTTYIVNHYDQSVDETLTFIDVLNKQDQY